MHQSIERLNAPGCDERLDALRVLAADMAERPAANRDVNNHIHTTYSFSPYSPTKAVWMAYRAQLSTAGIVDHDSIAGAREFLAAGRLLRYPVTCGFELRCTHTATALLGRKTNNPDQSGVSYMTFHGVPHDRFDAVQAFLKPVCEARGKRNRVMVARINALFDGVTIDYDADVLPLSMHHDGGSVTERHLLYALALALVGAYGRGDALVKRLAGLASVSDKLRAQLTDADNPHAAYDLLGFLKAEAVGLVYEPADDRECPDLQTTVKFAQENGIIITYPYLGDVTESVTGDKKAQTFEDAFLDELFDTLFGLGIRAVSYMPSRNTPAQLERLRMLCDRFQMLQISGEDINSPRQGFICEAMRAPGFANLYDTTWALIGHERLASRNIAEGFTAAGGTLAERIAYFKEKGREAYELG